MKISTIYKTISILSVIGMALALFLFYEYLFQPAFRPCSINAVVNFDAVISGPIRTFLGIPVSLIGLFGYIVIFLGSLLKNRKLVLGMVLFGMVFCIRLLFIELFILHVVCPVCVSCFIVMTTIFVLSIKLYLDERRKVTR